MKASARARIIDQWVRVEQRDCFWCGKLFTYRGSHAPSLEHFIPRSRGGAGGQANVVVAHRGCNNRRGNRIPNEAEMRRFIKAKGKVGIQVLRVFAEEIERSFVERSVSSQAASQPVAPTVLGRSLSIQVAG